MNIPKLAIFDMDGLLFDSERIFMEEKNKVLRAYGYPARREDYVQTMGLAGENFYQKVRELYGDDYPADEISEKTRAAVNAYMETRGVPLKPGILKLLRWFQEHGVCCCVASSTPKDAVAHYIALAGLDSYFSFLIGGEETARSKPAPDIFLAACAKGQTAPEDALVLEDSENGVRAALAAGIPVVCIPDLKRPAPELLQQAAAVLTSAAELIPLFS